MPSAFAAIPQESAQAEGQLNDFVSTMWKLYGEAQGVIALRQCGHHLLLRTRS
jgi:hypothetical protein